MPPSRLNIIENPQWKYTASLLKSVLQKKKELEAQEDMLVSLPDGQNCEKNGVKLTKYIRRESVDYNRILK